MTIIIIITTTTTTIIHDHDDASKNTSDITNFRKLYELKSWFYFTSLFSSISVQPHLT